MRVLVTGAAGSIGTVVCDGLVDRGWDVAGLDLVVEPEGFIGPWFAEDCADPDAVAAVFAALDTDGGLDAVVHLASIPHEASLPEILTSHVVTTAALLDAMVEHGVPRIVYASSNHAVGRTPRSELLTTAVRPRPDTFYGTGKVAAEALLSLYADRHGIDAVATRIGSFLPQPETRRHLSTWLSHDDAVRMVHAGLTAPDPGFAVLYGISANTRAWWDLDPGRALGYEPEDDAEHYAAAIEAEPATPSDEVEAAHVGGPFVTEAFYRPALRRS
ncbi:NAD(P)-dependent oxidoreductase [Nocardioides sp. WL0053]|uniref:NAD(P)-dependent oxidoreductase n=1 Tax=Nocardioides jiangsuensis TaxID=2866161 RepID=A0ABS7RS19_9ACTN|nr:NAD(P)-dependent oxidoreductase [Nocardioides jiangsuensis]MBY9076402.1 NAD(P)-dependent oxidoreductase [Nocardioides jiangsuensis]